MRRFELICVMLGLFFISWFSTPINVQAANNNRVLLVYDSQNTSAAANQNIDALQRTLTSMNLRVKTV